MKKRKIVIIFGVILSCCIAISVFLLSDSEESKKQREEERALREQIANIYGIPSSWDSITEHVDCVILAYGEPKEKIIQQLEKIPGYGGSEEIKSLSVIGNSTLHVQFSGEISGHIGWQLDLKFDQNDLLIDKGSVIGLADSRDMVCP
jgi:hypothetical protein